MSYRYPPAQSAEATSTNPSAACILSTATFRRGEGGPMLGPTGAVASHACWVTGIKLSAVQPACLRAHQNVSMISSTSEHMAAEVASQPEYHSLQLHLQVMLDSQPSSPSETSQDATPYGLVVGPSSLPMLLEHAVLELAVLTQHSQILNQQHSLLQLLQEQSQQTSQHEALEAAADLVPASTDLSSSWPMHLRVNVSCPPQHSEQPLSCLHLVVTVRTAEQPTQLQAPQQLLDKVQHSQQLEQGHSTEAGWTDAHQAARPAVGLIAEVPLLVLPAVAQQEVQQLLLPAMRQEVQAEQQQQQQQQHPELQQLSQTGSLPTANTASTSSEWAIEHRVWQHYQQLVNDIHTVMLLVDMLQSPAAEAAATSIAAEAAAAAVAAAAAQQQATAAGFEAAGVSEALRLDANDEAAGQTAAGAAAAPIGLSSAVALNSIADNLLFPVLLPFLAAHGLHNLLQLVVEYLPQQLQQQWEQQQLERLMVDEEIPATAAAAAVDPGTAVAGSVHTTAGREGASCAADAFVATQQQQQQQQQQQRQLEGDDPDSAVKPQQQQESSASSKQAQQQQRQDPKSVDNLCKDDDSNVEDLKGSSKPAAASAASSIAAEAGQQLQPAATGAAGPAPAVYWYTPLLQFNRAEESRYLTWKHYTLIHLDYIGALFAVMYLLALLKRMISEPTTLFYFIYVLLKCMPLAPLILGFRQPFLRYRELWLWLVIPASLLTFLWFLKVQKVGSPISLLPQKALSAYWNGRGEIMTSAMRPFIQHMRLRPYVAYTLADAVMVAWVFAQFYGWWAALGRWGFAASLSIGLCWGLDLHMRRRFAALRRS